MKCRYKQRHRAGGAKEEELENGVEWRRGGGRTRGSRALGAGIPHWNLGGEKGPCT